MPAWIGCGHLVDSWASSDSGPGGWNLVASKSSFHFPGGYAEWWDLAALGADYELAADPRFNAAREAVRPVSRRCES